MERVLTALFVPDASLTQNDLFPPTVALLLLLLINDLE